MAEHVRQIRAAARSFLEAFEFLAEWLPMPASQADFHADSQPAEDVAVLYRACRSTMEILLQPEQRHRVTPIDTAGPDAALNFWAQSGEACCCGRMQGMPAGMAQSAAACGYVC